MNSEKMLLIAQNLLAAVEMMYDSMPDLLTKKAIGGRLKVVDNTIAELRSEMQLHSSNQPQLNKPDVLRRYSCSLVYQNPAAQLLRALVTNAYSEDEALGKAIKHFEAEAKNYGLVMKCVIQIAE